MKNKQKKKPTKMLFIQDWGTYSNETLVAVGSSPREILEFAKRMKLKKAFVEWLSAKLDELNNVRPSDTGFVLHSNSFTVLWLREYEETWDYWSTLIHETTHLVDHVLRSEKLMHTEVEACAYQMEYIFNGIRRKIQGKV